MTAANCPSCGAQVTFAIGSSAVVICDTCRSIVARTDRGIETYGKVADLIDTGSPLQVGATGRHEGQHFRITGRTQLRHQAGGVWDEWYAALNDGRWMWLAEAQGRFYVTFPASVAVPPYEALSLGAPLLEGLVVAEFGEAALLSAEGELPWRPAPGYTYRYADLTGPNNRFATIDYSEEPPLVFYGTETTLPALGVTDVARPSGRVKLTTLNCPNCAGALELRAPDQAERIWCPYCGAGLNVTEGKLQYFDRLKKKKVEPVIPLGTTGTIDDDPYVVAGFMQRAVTFDRDYFWTEYLLYNPARGYRWLVHSDGHWSFVIPLRPGEVGDAQPTGAQGTVQYGGKPYRLFQQATARVTYVVGEFYWRVAVGEKADTVDYVRPPFGISKELSVSGAKEINYSHARYMQPKEVAKAFGIERLPRPEGIGPMQPFPGSTLGVPWLFMLLLLIGTAIFLGITLPNRTVHDRTYDVAAAAVPEGAPENARVLFSAPFQLTGEHNVQVRAEAATPLDNTWVHLGVDLVAEQSGVMQSFEMPLQYYSGVDGGERWSEGRTRDSTVLSRPEKGPHILRVETQWEPGKPPPQVRLTVREGVFRGLYFVLALLGISILPLLALIRKISFEARRWQESAHSPFGQFTAGDDDEEE
jgi:hypothetical protein